MNIGWSLPLRTWMTVALIAVILSPLLVWLTTIVAVQGPTKMRATPFEREALSAQEELLTLLGARAGEWETAMFRSEVEPLLERGGFAALLILPDGRTAYQSDQLVNTYRYEGGLPVQTGVRAHGNWTLTGTLHDADGQMAGTYLLVQIKPDPLRMLIVPVALVGLMTALVLTVWWVGRSISQPLHALARAAESVNQGELDFHVPTSRVKELNALGSAFMAMRDGLRSSIHRQAELEQERRLFIAAVAHDLRTPLSSVRGYLEGLHDGVARTPEQVQRYVRIALEKTGGLERLIESFFAYAKIEYLGQEPKREMLDLGDLLSTATEALRPRAQEKQVTLVLEPAAEPCKLMGDRHMIGRVVDNLLDNAIRHTPAGGTVRVGWRWGLTQFEFWVQDTGPGLAAGDLEKVFEPHYRGDDARSTATGGAGLGLAITRRLVQAHGGTITAANQEGARFTVTLPVEQ